VLKKIEKPRPGPLGAAERSERGPDTYEVLYCDMCGIEAPGPSDIDFIGWLDVEKSRSYYDESIRETVCPQCQDAGQRKRAAALVKKYLRKHYAGRAMQVGNQLRAIKRTLEFADLQMRRLGMIPEDDATGSFEELKRLKGYLK
jgi:hypothetical protein